MAETTAASSPAEVADVFNGQEVSLSEFSKYREDGTVPERFKPAEPAESAPADAPEETAETEDEPESEPEAEAQEQPQKVSPAEKRIKQLLAEKKELQRKLEAAAKPTQPDSSTAQAPRAPQNYQEYRQAFKPSAFIEEYGKQNPDATYEDANAAMADHLFEVRKHFETIEQRVTAERDAVNAKATAARERYENFDEIKDTFLGKVLVEQPNGTVIPAIPLQVLALINDSDVMPDLLYTIGSDEAELAKFVDMAKSNPNKAIRYVTKVESLIAEELAKPKETTVRGEDGKFKSSAPEKPKTQAPKPPSPVNSGGTSRGFDPNDESLPTDEWFRKRNAEVARKQG